jgi:hypothetical protein
MPGKDSADLLWDDINRPKFYTLLTLASAAIRTVLYPAALVKTRLQGSSGSSGPPPSAAANSGARMSLAGAGVGAPPRNYTFSSSAAATVPRYTSTGNAFATILRSEGKLALYRGFRMNLFGLACDPITIGTIEYTRTKLTYYWHGFDQGHGRAGWFFQNVMAPSTAITLICAGGSAVVGQIIQVPVDVISQKKQMQMHTLTDATGKFRKTEGTSVHTNTTIVKLSNCP